MCSSNSTNLHDVLGIGSNMSSSSQGPIFLEPSSRHHAHGGHENRTGPVHTATGGTAPAFSTATDDASRRAAIAATTEIGDPHGRIPTAEQTRSELEAIRGSQFPDNDLSK